ncbi:MAG: hypothetical protein QME59_00990 [Candidatus Hydrothermarchaeota archaeon]|nr:hypothetical protein [Candidatus Hydrothermarchaeota archaeon]
MSDRENNEELFRKDFVEKLKEGFRSGLEQGIRIEEKVKVLKDITILPNRKSFKLQFGFFEQDIVFYEEGTAIDISNKISDLPFKFTRIEEKGKIVIPLLIIEIKYGGVDSHQLITYSQIAGDIKNIFPFTKYYLIIRYTSKDKNLLLRHGKNFDRIVKFKGKDKDIKKYIKGNFAKELKDKELGGEYNLLIKNLKQDIKEVRKSIT